MFSPIFTEKEQATIKQCIVAILNGPFIDDWEFHIRLGVNRKVLEEILSAWPERASSIEADIFDVAVNNCMNEISHGLRISPEEWFKWFDVPRDDVRETFKKRRQTR